MSTYLQLCKALKRECGMSGTISTVASPAVGSENERVVNWVADADEMIKLLWQDWTFLHTEFTTGSTTSGTREYSLGDLSVTDMGHWDPSSFVLDPTLDTYQPLQEIRYEHWRVNEKLGVQTNAKPSHFVIKPDNAIVFWNTPDATYTWHADYYAKPTRLSANADESAIPSQFHRIITVRAKMLYAEHEDIPEILQVATREYADYLRRLEGHSLPESQWKTIHSEHEHHETVSE